MLCIQLNLKIKFCNCNITLVYFNKKESVLVIKIKFLINKLLKLLKFEVNL